MTNFFLLFLDGLTDCEDPECCESPVCQKSQLCHTVPQPIDILLRKQPPAMTASFFEQMKFIIEDKGLQSYVQRAGFNERYLKSSFQLTIYMSMLVCTGGQFNEFENLITMNMLCLFKVSLEESHLSTLNLVSQAINAGCSFKVKCLSKDPLK